MTLNLIETLKTSTYNPKHQKHENTFSKIQILQKHRKSILQEK